MDSERILHGETTHPIPTAQTAPSPPQPPPPPPSPELNLEASPLLLPNDPNLWVNVDLNYNQAREINYTPYYPPQVARAPHAPATPVFYPTPAAYRTRAHPMVSAPPYFPPPPPIYPIFQESEAELKRRARVTCFYRTVLFYLTLLAIFFVYCFYMRSGQSPLPPEFSITKADVAAFRPVASPGIFTPDISVTFRIRNPNNNSQIEFNRMAATLKYRGGGEEVEVEFGWTDQREFQMLPGVEVLTVVRVVPLDLSLTEEEMKAVSRGMERNRGVVEFEVKVFYDLWFSGFKWRSSESVVSCPGLKIQFLNGTAVVGPVKEIPESCWVQESA